MTTFSLFCVYVQKTLLKSPFVLLLSSFVLSCHSYVGRKTQGHQELNLGPNCNSLSVIIHEILHALGFLHEQSRIDRDTYVTINYANIDTNIQSEYLNMGPMAHNVKIKIIHIKDGLFFLLFSVIHLTVLNTLITNVNPQRITCDPGLTSYDRLEL